MDNVKFDADQLVIIEKGNDLFLRYDAGTHYPVIREDKITKEEAELIMAGHDSATHALFSIQRRLIDSGIDPYLPNISIPDN